MFYNILINDIIENVYNSDIAYPDIGILPL